MSNSTKKEHRRFLKKIRIGDLVTWGNGLSSHSVLEIKPDGVLVDLGDGSSAPHIKPRISDGKIVYFVNFAKRGESNLRKV